MLQLRNICKTYVTGDVKQDALKDVSVSFRRNEFVAVLGHSGSGKTTMLNIIGGLDQYTSGDLVIRGVSTRKYKDKDWDAYRNHSIGFVFQSYNLIPHQTVLANVELALTISGISKSERTKRAAEALKRVGLNEHMHKRPSQLSGGQMQRVAIARALINDPDILLADEPTGALDSETSVQVMEILKEIASDRLVIMVTHNPELAYTYANRIVRLADGRITEDSNPYVSETADVEKPKRLKNRSMSFMTSFMLSLNNLLTKKVRTFMTAFAGSIGIMGIALILAVSTGFQSYIDEIEEETMSSYPLTVMSDTVDATSMILGMVSNKESTEEAKDSDQVIEKQYLTTMFSAIGTNDLKSFKRYLESHMEEIREDVTLITYTYSVSPVIYTTDVTGTIVKVNPSNAMASLTGTSSSSSMFSAYSSNRIFNEMVDDLEMLQENYQVLSGRWPEKYDEMIIVLSEPNGISDLLAYQLGLKDTSQLKSIITSVMSKEKVENEEEPLVVTYQDLLDLQFKLIDVSSLYRYNEQYDIYEDMSTDKEYMQDVYDKAEDLHIVGIVTAAPGSNSMALSNGVCYTSDLTKHVIAKARNSEIVLRQMGNKEVDVFSNQRFDEEKESSGLDFEDMISIDEKALQEAFQFNLDLRSLSDPDALQEAIRNAAQSVTDNMNNSSAAVYALLQQLESAMAQAMIQGYNMAFVQDTDIPRCNEYADGMDMRKGCKVAEGEEDQYTEVSEGIFISNELGYYREVSYSEVMTNLYKEAFFEGDLYQTIVEQIASNMTMAGFSAEDIAALTKEGAIAGFDAYAEAARASAGESSYQQSIDEFLESEIYQQLLTRLSALLPQSSMEELDAQIRNSLAALLENAGGILSLNSYLISEEDLAALNSDAIIIEALNQEDISRNNTVNAAYMAKDLTALFVAQGIAEALAEILAPLNNMADQNIMQVDTSKFASAFHFEMSEEELNRLMETMMSSTDTKSYQTNLINLGYQDLEEPTSISFYFRNFDSKESFLSFLDGYNAAVNEEKKISYTDITGILMGSVKTIVNAVTYVLIAFVSISLIVSSIMIGVITLISVMERTKEIGILRAIGASKRDVGHIFNAETFIVGLLSGLIGVGVSEMLLIPINRLLYKLTDIASLKAILPYRSGIVLVVISVLLTLISGLIPSRSASNKNPVEALRTE